VRLFTYVVPQAPRQPAYSAIRATKILSNYKRIKLYNNNNKIIKNILKIKFNRLNIFYIK